MFDDDVPDGVSAPPDLSVSAAPLGQDVLPPASVLPLAQETLRRDPFATVQPAFEISAACGAVRTYEATLRNIVPKVTLNLGSQVLSTVTEAQFSAVFGALLMLGPKSASPAPAEPRVRWNYVKLFKSAVAHRHATRGERAVSDDHWTPRMGVFWAGIKRSCVHVAPEKSPLLLEEVSCALLRQAVGNSDVWV